MTSLGVGATSLHDFRSDPDPDPSRSCPPLARDVHPSQLHPEQDTFLDSRDPVWPLEAKGGVDRGSVFFALSPDITENTVEREEEGDCDSSGVRSSAFVFPATQTQSHSGHHRVSVCVKTVRESSKGSVQRKSSANLEILGGAPTYELG